MNLPPHFLALSDSTGEASRATSTQNRFSGAAEGVKTYPLVCVGEGALEPFAGPADDADGQEGYRRRGRKPVATPARLAAVCAHLAKGETERGACLAAGLGLTSWNMAKRGSRELREQVAAARQEWAKLRHAQHVAARLESQWARAAGQKALPPRPTKNARLVAWHLTHRVSLSLAALPAAEVTAACEHYGLSLDAWRRQERAFGLMAKVYARRARLRGDQPAQLPVASSYFAPAPDPWAGSFDRGSVEDEIARWRP